MEQSGQEGEWKETRMNLNTNLSSISLYYFFVINYFLSIFLVIFFFLVLLE